MTFRHLEAFVTTARTGSVTLAAEELLRTQPTVSGQLKELEEELGVALFHRLPRGVEPTEAGHALLEQARALLDGRQQLLDGAAARLGLMQGELCIDASNIPGEYLLPPLLGRFKADHPDLRVICRIHDSRETIEHILNGDAYLGVVGNAEDDPDLEFLPLWEDRLDLYAAKDFRADEKMSLDELKELPLVVREEGSATRKAAEKALVNLGFSPRSLNTSR